eukprot:3958791-Alexandrium_andersonii.AAC.1
MMSDSAPAFLHTSHPGVVDRHIVNHSEKEWSRSVSMLANATTRAQEPGTAGTQLLGRTWALLKREIP